MPCPTCRAKAGPYTKVVICQEQVDAIAGGGGGTPGSGVVTDQPASRIEINCLCDDVLGNSTSIVTFYEGFLLEVDTDDVFTSTSLGYFADSALTTPYTPINIIDCGSIGEDVIGIEAAYDVVQNGATWASDLLTQKIQIQVIAVGNLGTPPTLTTESGAQSLFVGTNLEWEAVDSSHVIRGAFSIATGAGDTVAIASTRLTTN